MNEIIKVEIKDGIQVIDSRIVAKGLDIQHHTLIDKIKKYQERLEKLGVFRFETEQLQKDSKGGRPEVFCYLNELQCHFVITLSRNTDAVVDFKLALVVAFDKAKKEIATLTEIIEESEDWMAKKRLQYEKEGYSKEWIQLRMKSIDVRSELETLWYSRGVKTPQQFASLTAIISKETFGITPKEHKTLKGLKNKDVLRDHQTRKELALTILAEVPTQEIAEAENKQGYLENKDAAKRGGQIAGKARLELEAETGKSVVSNQNFLLENRHLYNES